MASFTKLKSGKWRAQIRKDGIYTSKTFTTKTAARTWAQRIEVAIEAGMRQGGTLGLTCKGVDSDSRIIHLKDTMIG